MIFPSDPDIIKLIEYADIYRCPACGKGIDDDECEAEYLWRTGEIVEKEDEKTNLA
jgi:hypothetical protein